MKGQEYLRTPSGRVWNVRQPNPASIHWPDVAEIAAKSCYLQGAARGGMFSYAQIACLAHDQVDAENRVTALLLPASYAIVLHASRAVRTSPRDLGDPFIATLCDRSGDPGAMADEWPPAATACVKAICLAGMHDLLMPVDPRLRVWTSANAPRPQTVPLITPWPWAPAADEWLRRARLAGLTWEG